MATGRAREKTHIVYRRPRFIRMNRSSQRCAVEVCYHTFFAHILKPLVVANSNQRRSEKWDDIVVIVCNYLSERRTYRRGAQTA